MSLMTIIFFAVFIIPIALGIIFLRKSRKLSMIMLSIPFIFIIGVGLWWFYEVNHRFVGNTELAGEQIGEFSLQDDVNEELLETYGTYTLRENVNYDELLAFDDLEIGTSIHDKIIYIQTGTSQMPTKQGIKVGDRTEDVIERYGDKHYNRQDMGMGESLNYVDRDAKIHLQFWLEDGEITHISLNAL
ncbi:MAG TPA: hypothetical protein VK077_10400 [Virgibacillus sp.]|nr:hypothetical protein [Virgibacillus sp.]